MLNPEHRGVIPEAGVFSVARWAGFIGVSEDTIRRWISKYEIPYFKPGDRMFISAKDFLDRIPYHTREPPVGDGIPGADLIEWLRANRRKKLKGGNPDNES